MMKLMGFAGFDTSKGKGVEDNKRGPAKGAVSKHKEREYRQYMNRRGVYRRWLEKPSAGLAFNFQFLFFMCVPTHLDGSVARFGTELNLFCTPRQNSNR